jgi:hypothetical protein
MSGEPGEFDPATEDGLMDLAGAVGDTVLRVVFTIGRNVTGEYRADVVCPREQRVVRAAQAQRHGLHRPA